MNGSGAGLLRRLIARPSIPGLCIGTLFFAASLTPSLVPREFYVQGALAGVAIATGYALGVLGVSIWRYLELPLLRGRAKQIAAIAAGIACAAVALFCLSRAAEWQNSIRALMELPPVDSAHPYLVVAIALPLAAVLVLLARLFAVLIDAAARALRRFIPRRIAHAASIAGALFLFWTLINGVLFRTLLTGMDASFQQVDSLIEPELAPPADPARSGSAESLIGWEELGYRGREYVSAGPSADDLARFFGTETPAPIRVYVGLNSAETIEERAELALAELERVGAFERSNLILVTPTGTGWIDPRAVDTMEYVLRGDVASVAVQYSYLPSWLTLLSQPDYGAETARAVFAEIYGHWTELPRDRRPRLYLHGMSLGALNSDRGSDLFDVLADPFHGALWSGPPFRAETWRQVTAAREPGSPAWLPRFRDGSIVRFKNQHDTLDIPGAKWGPLRIVFLQYASDPITFFEPRTLYRKPEWLYEPRGPDVSPSLRWFPVITMLQIGADIIHGGDAPAGFGHVLAADDYIDCWLEVTGAPGWTDADAARLKRLFPD